MPIISDNTGSLIIGGGDGAVQIVQPFPAIVVQTLELEYGEIIQALIQRKMLFGGRDIRAWFANLNCDMEIRATSQPNRHPRTQGSWHIIDRANIPYLIVTAGDRGIAADCESLCCSPGVPHISASLGGATVRTTPVRHLSIPSFSHPAPYTSTIPLRLAGLVVGPTQLTVSGFPNKDRCWRLPVNAYERWSKSGGLGRTIGCQPSVLLQRRPSTSTLDHGVTPNIARCVKVAVELGTSLVAVLMAIPPFERLMAGSRSLSISSSTPFRSASPPKHDFNARVDIEAPGHDPSSLACVQLSNDSPRFASGVTGIEYRSIANFAQNSVEDMFGSLSGATVIYRAKELVFCDIGKSVKLSRI
ncbi:hypothetical protein BDM02DRAFT_3132828 [Thelephora ganbajun]|uniref:Uncharacterized protein n=1 Tax=Thelephora ganbajun TaxID=370292 RepID=A0ACB6Z036_THEGA|nr:hypothetical protein BDM02DRAFT_3132828 [Thelephora ganbajun]